MLADLKVIDLDHLSVAAPHPVHNEVTYRDGAFAGALPGRLVRGARAQS